MKKYRVLGLGKEDAHYAERNFFIGKIMARANNSFGKRSDGRWAGGMEFPKGKDKWVYYFFDIKVREIKPRKVKP